MDAIQKISDIRQRTTNEYNKLLEQDGSAEIAAKVASYESELKDAFEAEKRTQIGVKEIELKTLDKVIAELQECLNSEQDEELSEENADNDADENAEAEGE
jgi:ribulose bisphosphate carboxylase small subunit